MSDNANSKRTNTDLPEGTVTFLFTDIEGSTKLLKQLGADRYGDLLAAQRRILRSAFAQYNGTEIDTQGDSFFVSFPRATQAIAAVVEIQRVLAAHDWPEGVEVRLRMGLHTGEPLVAEEGYVGMDVHRVARIAHAGHGGQVLLSETTTALVIDELPEGVELLDLSRHRLKDMHRPEWIHQLVIEGLPSEFPPLKSLEMLPPAISLDIGDVKLPAFLEEEGVEVLPAVFVGRERELTRLDGFLSQAGAGQGGVLFITGGPGEGKTALLEAFVRQGLKALPDLIVASGRCNAYTGVGDPYLPFREVLSDLSGDVKTKWAAGAISSELARRLWGICPLTAQSLVESGPELVEVIISGEELLARVSIQLPDQRDLLQRLRVVIKRQRTTPGDLEQKALYTQYTRVLCQIAEAHPLLLLLDDLQWADAASINLLFHLGRHLGGSRILVVGAYRPEEVALSRGKSRHPLESVLNELKRQFGQVWIDLSDVSQTEGFQFLEALLDSEPNHLGRDFRQAFFSHTTGHALFTVELLRDLQERGDLIKDDSGNWIADPDLDWEILPARVDGVIAARIGRLRDELRDILTVASVEGEDFTAQVVARVKKVDERGLVHQLSGELDKVHRLVGERGRLQIGEQRLYLYRFQHHLFQKYLYNGLGDNERELLHTEVGGVLEELYAGNTQAISLQLAHHYSIANEGEKAVPYLLQAGDQARNLYAHREAIGYYHRALEFQEGLGDYGGAARTQMKLGQTYHSAFDYRKANESYAEGFRLWQRATEKRSAIPPAIPPQTFKMILPQDPFTLDPGLATDSFSTNIIRHLFCGLLEYTPEMDVFPDLAQRWQILEGGQRYIFHLQEDLYWSDGVSLTANDFVYAWSRFLNPATQSRTANLLYDIKGARAYHLGETSATESLGLRAVDPHTLEVELEAPVGYFLQLMAYPATYPVPRHVVERLGAAWTDLDNLVVNGPFKIESRRLGESLILVRNSKYSGRFRGNIQQIEISLIPDWDWLDMLTMYETNELGKLDITYFPTAEIIRLKRQCSAEYISTPRQAMHYLVFNTSRAPFDDPRVRRAFMLTVDRERAPKAPGGADIPALGGLIPPGIPGHSPEIGLPYDPDGARELMAQAGYPGGRGFPTVEVLLWPDAKAQLESIMIRWQELLGVEYTWDFTRIIDVIERAKAKPPHMAYQGWMADYPDPDNFLRVGLKKDLSGWKGERFDVLVERARRTQDQSERIRLYQRADKMLIDEAIVLPLAYDISHFLVKPWVKYYPLSPYPGGSFLKDVIIEPH